MKTTSLLLALIILASPVGLVRATPSGASLKTTLSKQVVDECSCLAFVLSAEVARYYSYKVQSTTNLSQPTAWIDELNPFTSTDTNISWAMPLESRGNKFFRVVELGEAPHVEVSINPISPPPGAIPILTNGTHNVPLITYDLKSRLTNSTMRSLLVIVGAHSPTNTISSIFSGVNLRVGGLTYAGVVVSTGTSDLFGGSYGWKVQFSNLVIPLPAEIKVPVTIMVDVVPDPTGILNNAGVYVGDNGLNIEAEDSGYSTVPAEKGPLDTFIFTLVE